MKIVAIQRTFFTSACLLLNVFAVSVTCDAECSTEEDIDQPCSIPCAPEQTCLCKEAEPPVVCVRYPCLIATCVTLD